MINVTAKGNEVFTAAIVGKLDSLHLFTESGELSGYGYEPIQLQPTLWKGGIYPTQEWKFMVQEGEGEVQAIGWYIVGHDGQVLMSERFVIEEDSDYLIRRTDDRIKVKPKLSLITSSGGMV